MIGQDKVPWPSFSEGWVLSQLFHSPPSLSSKTLFSSSLSAIRVVSFAYLRLLIFLLAILIPACAPSSPVFLMMYSAQKWNKQPMQIPKPSWMGLSPTLRCSCTLQWHLGHCLLCRSHQHCANHIAGATGLSGMPRGSKRLWIRFWWGARELIQPLG